MSPDSQKYKKRKSCNVVRSRMKPCMRPHTRILRNRSLSPGSSSADLLRQEIERFKKRVTAITEQCRDMEAKMTAVEGLPAAEIKLIVEKELKSIAEEMTLIIKGRTAIEDKLNLYFRIELAKNGLTIDDIKDESLRNGVKFVCSLGEEGCI